MQGAAVTGSVLDTVSRLGERVAELRADFDRSFAAPLRADITQKLDLLAIRVGSEPCAIRLSDVVGLFSDRRITRVPGSNAALLGIAGFRGVLIPVYGLRTLLGHSGTQAPRWLVIAAGSPVALAFDAFEGHLRAAADAILPQQTTMRGCAREFIRTADAVGSVLHMPSVIEALGAAERPDAGTMKERGVRSNER
jgi:chemotaxis signal transduction protein